MKDAEMEAFGPLQRPLSRLQWGRVLKDAEIRIDNKKEKKNKELQWGRVLKDAEIPSLPGPWRSNNWLQWGRVLKDAEILAKYGSCMADPCASMGPRLEGRGNWADLELDRATAGGFNGAAS